MSDFFYQDGMEIKNSGKDFRKKPIETKTTMAKKILRKGIKLNTKTTFDEDGEVFMNDIFFFLEIACCKLI